MFSLKTNNNCTFFKRSETTCFVSCDQTKMFEIQTKTIFHHDTLYFVICAHFAWFLYRDYILYIILVFIFLSNNENMRRHRYYNKRTRSVFRKWKYNRCGLERCCIRLLRYSARTHARTHTHIFTCSNKKEKIIIIVYCVLHQ